ncbi:MAG: cytochrome c family protein [Phycisphaerales bacterium]|nr:cytochrome c family protein [Phycisphaerales bacterium]
MNSLPPVLAVGVVGGLTAAVGLFWYYATPKFWRVGYMPVQPGGGFNHQLHAGKLGMDCRYCHSKIEQSSEANIPSVHVCYGCHADNRLVQFTNATHKAKTDFVREAYVKDEPIAWNRVHKLPDYVRNFPHDIHIAAGVSCYSCHGQIMGMPIVYHAQPLSMSWCLDCHRDVQVNPQNHLVPKDMVTKLIAVENRLANPQEHAGEAAKLLENIKLVPPENCGACHY